MASWLRISITTMLVVLMICGLTITVAEDGHSFTISGLPTLEPLRNGGTATADQKTMVSDNIKYITFRDTYGGDNDRTYFLHGPF